MKVEHKILQEIAKKYVYIEKCENSLVNSDDLLFFCLLLLLFMCCMKFSKKRW